LAGARGAERRGRPAARRHAIVILPESIYREPLAPAVLRRRREPIMDRRRPDVRPTASLNTEMPVNELQIYVTIGIFVAVIAAIAFDLVDMVATRRTSSKIRSKVVPSFRTRCRSARSLLWSGGHWGQALPSGSSPERCLRDVIGHRPLVLSMRTRNAP